MKISIGPKRRPLCSYKADRDTCADPEGGGGDKGPDPLKNHKNIGFLSNTCPDPL